MNKYAADRPAMWKRSGWSTIQIRCALPNSSNISLKITIQPKQTGKGPTSAHSTRDRRCAEKHSDPERRASRHADFACPSFLACRGLPSGLLSETRPDAILSSHCAAVLAQSHRRKWNVQNLSRYGRFLNACACGKVRQSASILFHSWAVTGVTDKRLPFCKSCMVLTSGICLKVRSAITSLNVLSHCTSTQYQIGLSGVDLGS